MSETKYDTQGNPILFTTPMADRRECFANPDCSLCKGTGIIPYHQWHYQCSCVKRGLVAQQPNVTQPDDAPCNNETVRHWL